MRDPRPARSRRWPPAFVAVAPLVLVSALALAPAARATTIHVTTTADAVANDGACSLREALTAVAKGVPSGLASGECPAGTASNKILLGPGRYGLSLTGGPDDTNAGGDLDLTAGAATIVGIGESRTTINGNGIDRVLDVLAGSTLTLENLTVTGGQAAGGSAGTQGDPGGPGSNGGAGGDSAGTAGGNGSGGGGIRNAGTLTLAHVLVTGNFAGGGGAGGGSSMPGDGGSAAGAGPGGGGGNATGGFGGDGGDGGGLLSTAGSVTITDSTFSGNASGQGGNGGSALSGGHGGDAGGLDGNGGSGGRCTAGFGGSGGNGGAIELGGGSVAISQTKIEHNMAGSGGAGGNCANGGAGGLGSGSGRGGDGGSSIAADGGFGGSGGGVGARGGTLSAAASTIAFNTAGAGGFGGIVGSGGDGGLGGGPGGNGGFDLGGSGSEGGLGGGLVVLSATAMLTDLTVTGNQAGAGGPGADATAGGAAGGGSSTGAPGTSLGGGGAEGGFGGGIELDGPFILTDATITANSTGAGGAGGAGGLGPGASSGGSGGEGGFGGGAAIQAPGAVAHVTAVSNVSSTAGAGGGAGSGSPSQPGTGGENGAGRDIWAQGLFGAAPQASLSASIAGDCAGTLADGGGNVALAAAKPCPGAIGNPALGRLADNGGPTMTMALRLGSLAVDRIRTPCGTMPDQRGVPRPQGRGCDAGAYELAPPSVFRESASTVKRTSTKVSARIDPFDRLTTWHIEFGTTKRYGHSTRKLTVAPGLAAVGVSATLAGLRPGSLIHYRVVATSADGTTRGADATVRTRGRRRRALKRA